MIDKEDFELSKHILEKSIIVDLLAGLFLLGLILNYWILLLSIKRLIKFLTNQGIIRWCLYLSVVPIGIFYLTECIIMMVDNWGAPAFNLSSRLQI